MTSLPVEIIVLVLASTVQLAAAGVAFYLMRFSGKYRYAWFCIAFALFLMSERRIEPLYYAVIDYDAGLSLNALVGLAISLLMLVGVLGVRTLFLQLQAQEQELRLAATIDDLTGVPNHRATIATALQETERHLRVARPLALLMVDIDKFKQVNDSFGHLRGDEVLREVAMACQRALRKIDLFGRVGGEEFLALLPETSLDAAQAIAERLRDSVARRPLAGGVPVTVSVGVTVLDHTATPAEFALTSMMTRADQALYAAKSAGRNRVEAAAPSR